MYLSYPVSAVQNSGSTIELRRLRELEKENARLKRIVVDRDLEIDALRELVSKNY